MKNIKKFPKQHCPKSFKDCGVALVGVRIFLLEQSALYKEINDFEKGITKEVWKDVFGYEGLYKVSNLGRIKILGREVTNSRNPNFKVLRKDIIAKKQLDKEGYENIILVKDKKQKRYFVHRLVATSFIKNSKNKPQVNHKNGIHNDNRKKNLEWCTQSENMIHSFKVLGNKSSALGKFGKDNHSSVKVIQLSLTGKKIKTWSSIADAVRCGFNSGSISACCKGKLKTHKKFKWKYVSKP